MLCGGFTPSALSANELKLRFVGSVESAATAIAVMDDALRPRTPPPPIHPVIAPPAAPVRTMMDSLKPPTLCLDSTPYDLKQYKTKFSTYFRRSCCDPWAEHEDKHNAFFGCIKSSRILSYNAVRSIQSRHVLEIYSQYVQFCIFEAHFL